MEKTNLDILKKISSASSDLLWLSESDYPFEAITFSQKDLPEMQEGILLKKLDKQADTLVKKIEFEKFFQRATKEEDWHNTSDKATVKQYQKLVNLLQNNLHNLQVYLLGEIEIDVYILGQLPSGDWAGLSTKMVQT